MLGIWLFGIAIAILSGQWWAIPLWILVCEIMRRDEKFSRNIRDQDLVLEREREQRRTERLAELEALRLLELVPEPDPEYPWIPADEREYLRSLRLELGR